MMKTLLLLLLFLLTGTPSPKQEDSLRRTEMYNLYLEGKTEEYLQACENLIAYHREQGNEKYKYDAYATLFDRYQAWGREEEAARALERMSEEAQRENSPVGRAITAFCFGQQYLANHLSPQAEPYYRSAMQQLYSLGEYSRAIRAGFNLQAIAMNEDNLKKGLAINDSTQLFLSRLEQKNGRMLPTYRLKQVRYRFTLLWRMDSLAAAAPLKDTLLYYAQHYNDSSQDELIQSSLAGFEQKAGLYAQACERMDSLATRFLREKNYRKAAQYHLALAGFQQENGDYQEALENYRLYAAESDSALVHSTTEQLNELTKTYELNELRLENRLYRGRILLASLVAVFLASLCVGLAWMSLSLSRKNKQLFLAAQENIRIENAAQEFLRNTPDSDLSPEYLLFKRLNETLVKEEVFRNPDLNRETLATLLGTNRTYLCNAVTSVSGGQDIREYINSFRLRYAAEYLRQNPDTPVSTVGELSGFKSSTTFHRLFKDYFGIPPSEYRENALNKK